MYKVKMQNPCSCFLRSGMAEILEFPTQEKAQKEAEKIIDTMQNTFCNKHKFTMNEQFGDYTIFMMPRF